MAEDNPFLVPMPALGEKITPPVQVAEKPRFDLGMSHLLRLTYEQALATATTTDIAVRSIPEIETRAEEVVEINDPTLIGDVVAVDDYVPADIEQRLIYYWLLYGPEWRAELVAQAPEPPPDVIVNPLDLAPRRIGDGDDGAPRMIRLRA